MGEINNAVIMILHAVFAIGGTSPSITKREPAAEKQNTAKTVVT